MCICRGSCCGSSGCWLRPRGSVAASESRGMLAVPAGSGGSSAPPAGPTSGVREDSAGRRAGRAGWAGEGMEVGASGNATAEEEELAHHHSSHLCRLCVCVERVTFWLHLSVYIAHVF